MALGTALLASAGLLVHSFVKVMRTDRGYQIERVLAVDLSLLGKRYSTGENRVAFYRELVENVRTLPGVLAAGAISDLPAVLRIIRRQPDDFSRDGRKLPELGTGAARGYDSKRNKRLLCRQRQFAEGRSILYRPGASSGGVDQRVSCKPPLAAGNTGSRGGPHLRQGNVTGPLITVVGVVEDVRPGAVDRELPPIIYRPHPQWSSGPMTLVVRTAQEPAALVPAVRAEIRKDGSEPSDSRHTDHARDRLRIGRTTALPDDADFLVCSCRASAWRGGCIRRGQLFGSLPDAGYRTSDRARGDEKRRDALGLFEWHAAGPDRAPRRVGWGDRDCQSAAQPAVRDHSNRPRLAWQVVLVLLFTSGLACYVPARRAARLDPMTALRHE